MPVKFPVTPATNYLDKQGVMYIKHAYDYQRKGSDIAAEGLGVGLHEVVKTLVMQRENGTPFIVLQHTDLKHKRCILRGGFICARVCA